MALSRFCLLQQTYDVTLVVISCVRVRLVISPWKMFRVRPAEEEVIKTVTVHCSGQH